MSGVENGREGIDLDAIRARVDDATEGPWSQTHDRLSLYSAARTASGHGIQGSIFEHGSKLREASDAEFIAHARTDVPALLSVVAEQDAEIARLQSACEVERARATGREANAALFRLEREGIRRRLGAVAALADEWTCNCGGPSPEGRHEMHCDSYYGDRLRAALGPASGAVEGAGDTGAAVEAAARAIQKVSYSQRWDDADEDHRAELRSEAKAAIEAALPHLSPANPATPVAGHEQEVRAEEAVRPCEECGVEVHVEDGWWRDDSGNAHELIDDDKDDCMCGVYEYRLGEHLPPCPLAARASGSSAPVQGGAA